MPKNPDCQAGTGEELSALSNEVIAEVLETMFFTSAIPATCQHHRAEPALHARIEFSGSILGTFETTLDQAAARSLGSGFLGLMDDEVTEEGEEQVLSELTNILCGSLLSRLYPDARVILGPPHVLIPGQPVPSGGHRFHQCYEMAEGWLSVTIGFPALCLA